MALRRRIARWDPLNSIVVVSRATGSLRRRFARAEMERLVVCCSGISLGLSILSLIFRLWGCVVRGEGMMCTYEEEFHERFDEMADGEE
jgi:hypothetical protein